MKDLTQHHVIAWLADKLVDEPEVTEAEGRIASVLFKNRAKECRAVARTAEKGIEPSVHLIEAEVYDALSKLFLHPDSWRPE